MERALADELSAARGGGAPLPRPARAELEQGLGADLAAVRLHRGARADALAEALGATAFTTGHDVFLHRTAPEPSTSAGRHLLTHEVFHVLQQHGSPVDGTPGPGGLRISHPSDRHERAAADAADRLDRGARPDPIASAGATQRGVVVQRQTGLELLPAAPFLIAPSALAVPPATLPLDGTAVPWAGSALETAASAASRLGLPAARVAGQGIIRIGGAALADGAAMSGTGAAVSGAAVAPGIAVVAGPAVAGPAVVTVGPAVVAEGVGLVAGPTATLLGTTALATTGEAALATTATTAALISPVGWVVIGVVVVVVVGGAAIYLLTREYEPVEIVAAPRVPGATRGTGKGSMAPIREPLEAPGAPTGAPMQEPVAAPPMLAPGTGVGAEVREPETGAPALAPGAQPAVPMQAAGTKSLEGLFGVHVYRADGSEITDIDQIRNDILWEIKDVYNVRALPDPDNPKTVDIATWVDYEIRRKVDLYLEARQRPPLAREYSDATIGFKFTSPVKLGLAEAIWLEVERLKVEHPDVDIVIDWHERQSEQR